MVVRGDYDTDSCKLARTPIVNNLFSESALFYRK